MDIDWRAVVVGFVVVLVVGSVGGIALPVVGTVGGSVVALLLFALSSGIAGAIGGWGESL